MQLKEDRDRAYRIAVEAGAIRLLAEAKLGELLIQEIKRGRPEKGRIGTTFLKDIGLTRDESSRAQTIARFKDIYSTNLTNLRIYYPLSPPGADVIQLLSRVGPGISECVLQPFPEFSDTIKKKKVARRDCFVLQLLGQDPYRAEKVYYSYCITTYEICRQPALDFVLRYSSFSSSA